MSSSMRPIPAFYAVYVLRSTMRHASVYIGSTPHPPRRLKQHNGEARGGAVRTSRATLRPWEVMMLVSGFPSQMAALKFEWALTNPHVTLHIPDESRITTANPKLKKKKNGHARRPLHSLKSVVSNLELLCGVPSFARWPLSLHFFVQDAHTAWERHLASKEGSLKRRMRIIKDFESAAGASQKPTGIHALPLDYAPMKAYVEKAHNAVLFEQQGSCVHCDEDLEPGKGLYPMCPNEGCTAMGHLDCWSRHALAGAVDGAVIPDECACPSCGGPVIWGDMMKELTLRERGPKEVEKLLKTRRRGRKAALVETEAV